MGDIQIEKVRPFSGRGNYGLWIVLSTGLGSTSLTHQPVAIQKFDPLSGVLNQKHCSIQYLILKHQSR